MTKRGVMMLDSNRRDCYHGTRIQRNTQQDSLVALHDNACSEFVNRRCFADVLSASFWEKTAYIEAHVSYRGDFNYRSIGCILCICDAIPHRLVSVAIVVVWYRLGIPWCHV